MVPLKTRGSGADSSSAAEETQVVEVVYFTPLFNVSQTPGKHQLSVSAPLADVPVLRFSVGIYVPDSIRYSFKRPGRLDLLQPCQSHSSHIGNRIGADRKLRAGRRNLVQQGREHDGLAAGSAAPQFEKPHVHVELQESFQQYQTSNRMYKRQGTLPVSIAQPVSKRGFCHSRLMFLSSSTQDRFSLDYSSTDSDSFSFVTSEWLRDPVFPPPMPVAQVMISVVVGLLSFLCVICARLRPSEAAPASGEAVPT
jgi:hypothetical protein